MAFIIIIIIISYLVFIARQRPFLIPCTIILIALAQGKGNLKPYWQIQYQIICLFIKLSILQVVDSLDKRIVASSMNAFLGDI